jgi:photosystem II stability/assembly factor-like uncharacterized protein
MFHEDITLYRTLDGGTSWNKLTGTQDASYTIPDVSKSGLIFTDEKHGWITTQTPQTGFLGLFQTTDGGATWSQKQIDVPKEYADIEFLTYPPVFFSSKDALLLTNTTEESLDQLVYVTHDGGNSWTSIHETEDSLLQWSYDSQASESFAEGWTIQYNDSSWTTKDGLTWE